MRAFVQYVLQDFIQKLPQVQWEAISLVPLVYLELGRTWKDKTVANLAGMDIFNLIQIRVTVKFVLVAISLLLKLTRLWAISVVLPAKLESFKI